MQQFHALKSSLLASLLVMLVGCGSSGNDTTTPAQEDDSGALDDGNTSEGPANGGSSDETSSTGESSDGKPSDEEPSGEESSDGESSNEESTTEKPADDAPDVSFGDNSSAAAIHGHAVQLALAQLVELNRAISEGRELTTAESTCLAGYDASLGAPLLAIDCGDATALTSPLNATIQLRSAAVHDTSGCRASLQGLGSDGCSLSVIDATITQQWSTPTSGLPQPYASGQLIVDDASRTLTVKSIDGNDLTTPFECNVSLDGGAMSSPSGSPCTSDLARIEERLQALLASPE
ncbi:MAG: hypothetical protein CSB44_08855 [Gammaproteobacteria bacterium]|nr:MAG: hypothetical protein CSB44_08855 [Gammaproteobacteria bacterium]